MLLYFIFFLYSQKIYCDLHFRVTTYSNRSFLLELDSQRDKDAWICSLDG